MDANLLFKSAMKRSKVIHFLLVCMLSFVVVMPEQSNAHMQYFVLNAGGLSLERAIDRVKSRKKVGRILSAASVTVNGHEEHRVKILTKGGRVKVIRINAATGKTIRNGKHR
jgi:hypothetical protein